MTAKKITRARAKLQKRRLPPDPDGLFKRAGRRAKKVIALYDLMNPGLGRDYLVCNLLHDLMHLCDRDPTLGGFDESCGTALAVYEGLVEENEEESAG